ncbi:hypothetical protein B0A50_04680 [Salinomyces thailandicus]|uniref:Xylanolytic transcriptional activator regulatory domain-containing protein n=1 Tax=Salinomyces thailandicus TaxID=706561 RepID=A0A4U0TV05_9PEZI|nr:hypothetical protein B0A50_04680 [Salinomyces thailandica]
MTDRQATLKLMYTYPVDGVLRFDAMNGDYAELWSILALSSIIIPNHSGQFDTERLHNVARSLIPSERNVYERGHLKALVLLAILEMARQQWLAGWVLIGCAIRIILATTSSQSEAFPESHLNFGMPLRESATGDKLKHVGLAAYVVESAIAAHIGAPTHIQPEQMSMFGSLDEDGLEEWSPWHDPLSNTHGADIKTPARSYSTLNQLVRLALRNEGMGLVDFTQSSTNAVYRTILRLLQNAMQAENRLQPATIVSQSESAAQGHGGAHGPTHYASMAPGNFALDAFSAPGTSRQYTQQQLGYMSIPETTESAFSGSPLVQTGNTNPTTAGSWTQDNPAGIMSLPDTDNSTVAGADIFEELALLERTDSRSNPQFMQNLGFAPDIDLAEFFGADYQPSDPMLAYMQPSLFNPPSNGELQAPDMG